MKCESVISVLAKRPHGENITLAEGNKRTRKIQYQLNNKIELQLDHNAMQLVLQQ